MDWSPLYYWIVDAMMPSQCPVAWAIIEPVLGPISHPPLLVPPFGPTSSCSELLSSLYGSAPNVEPNPNSLQPV